METVRNYVEALFSALPQTEDIVQMKRDMLFNLEEKYNALLQEGKNEHEAAGIVVASIGSAEELRSELGLDDAVAEVPMHMSREPIDPAILEEYRQYNDKKHLTVALAVALFIASPILYQLCAESFLRSELLGQVLMFGAVAAGVVLCILSGRRDSYYKEVFGLGGENESAPSSVAGESNGGIRYRWTRLFAGVSFPIAAMIYLCLGFFADLWHPGWIIFPICGVLTGVIGTIEYFRQTQ